MPVRLMKPWLCGAALALLTACPPNSNSANLAGDPPQVTLTLPDTNHVGTSFRVTVQVSGCDTVNKLSLFDHGSTYLRDVTYVAGGTSIDLKPNEVPYTHGIAAQLELTAHVECSDGRTADSAPQSGSFFPVESIVTPTAGGQVVPTFFFAEGAGDLTYFFGCGADASGTYLEKVHVSGVAVATQRNLPVQCSTATQYSDKNPVTKHRWMMEPGLGLLEFDSNLNILTSVQGSFTAMGVAPDGDVVAYSSGLAGGLVMRYPHDGGTNAPAKWQVDVGSVGSTLAGGPQVNPDGTVFLAYFTSGGSGQFSVTSERLDYRNGDTSSSYLLRTVAYSGTLPPAALSPSGSVIYLPDETAPGYTTIRACATNAPSCTDTGVLLWSSDPLPGNARLLLPFAQGSQLAVVTTTNTFFIHTGPPPTLGVGGVSSVIALTPSTPLVPMFVQPGLGRDFYLFNGLPTGSVPTEVIGMDSQDSGPVFQYKLPTDQGGGISGAVADDGQLWLRINANLVKPLSNVQYRLGRTNHP